MTAATELRTLVKKLANIMAELGPLPRTGQKKGQTRAGGEFAYDVFLEKDILQPVQRALAAHGIVIVPEVVALDRRELPPDKPDRSPQRLVDVLVKFTVCDADSNEQLVGQAPGSAEERGDGTGVSKAFGDANKSFLRKLFEIAADEQGKATPRASQSRPTSPPPPAAANGSDVISEGQRRRLFAICKELSLNPDCLKDHIFKTYAFASSKDITKDRYESICRWLQGGDK